MLDILHYPHLFFCLFTHFKTKPISLLNNWFCLILKHLKTKLALFWIFRTFLVSFDSLKKNFLDNWHCSHFISCLLTHFKTKRTILDVLQCPHIFSFLLTSLSCNISITGQMHIIILSMHFYCPSQIHHYFISGFVIYLAILSRLCSEMCIFGSTTPNTVVTCCPNLWWL